MTQPLSVLSMHMKKARAVTPRSVGGVALLSALLVLLPSTGALALTNAADDTAQTNGTVFASVQYGGVLFIGGEFTRVNPPASGGSAITVQNLAAVDMSTGKGIAAFHPAVTGNAHQEAQIQSLAVVGNTLYVGGQFDAVDGHAHYNMAAIDIDPGTIAGTVDGTFNATVGLPGAAGEAGYYAYSLLVGSDGVYVGGAFNKVDGASRGNVAKLNWDGTLVNAWNVAGLNSNVRDLQPAPSGNTIFVAGAFSAPRQSILRVSTSTGALDSWAIPAGGVIVGDSTDPGMTCWSLAVAPSRLFAACGRQPNYVAAFRLDNGNAGDRAWSYKLVGNPQAISLTANGKSLLFGGHFGTFLKQKVCGGKLLKNLGIFNSIFTAKPKINCNFRPNFEGQNPFGGVWDIQVRPTYFWVSGGFDTIGTVAHRGIARFTS